MEPHSTPAKQQKPMARLLYSDFLLLLIVLRLDSASGCAPAERNMGILG